MTPYTWACPRRRRTLAAAHALAVTLGRAPTQGEYQQHGIYGQRLFGSRWTRVLHLATGMARPGP